MGLSPRTVQAHLASIFSKMGASSRTDAVIKGLRGGVISEDDLGCGARE
jgi:DNA-binding NarL/FixJ family response regulator